MGRCDPFGLVSKDGGALGELRSHGWSLYHLSPMLRGDWVCFAEPPLALGLDGKPTLRGQFREECAELSCCC